MHAITTVVALLDMAQALHQPANCGDLTSFAPDGRPAYSMPLKNTKVDAEVTGIGARVVVTQTFQNTSKTPIEAVYTFPLPADAAVDRLRAQVGGRVIEGEIRKKEEARAIYNQARMNGQVAALLDQERPNIFTQSIANVMPGAEVQVEISYVQTLKYEDGEYEFNFPMVVGPRNTMAAPDPGAIAPPTLPPGVRSGADIQLHLAVNAGAKVTTFRSLLHQIRANEGDGRLTVDLARAKEMANRDFVFRYSVAGHAVKESFLTNAGPDGGTFAVLLNPPKPDAPVKAGLREIYFVMDQSGSQQGFPLEKSKELTLAMIDQLRPDDTFNVATFTTTNRTLWPEAVPADPEHIAEATRFVKGLEANGGTNILGVVQMINSLGVAAGRDRIVLLNTDGYVGDDFEILQEVRKAQTSRWFTFGIGNSVNRFLIDAMAAEGRGGSEVVTLADGADRAVQRLAKRLKTPVLTDVHLTVDGVPVQMAGDAISDVYADQPVVAYGRYTRAGRGKVVLTGKMGGQPYRKEWDADFPARGNTGSAITSLWARQRVDHLLRQNWTAARGGKSEEAKSIETQVTDVALRYHIMSPFTSFVAVEPRVVNVGGKQRQVRVPVEMADGVDMSEKMADKRAVNQLGLVPANNQNGATLVYGRAGAGRAPGGGGFGGAGGGAAKPAAPAASVAAGVYLSDLAAAPAKPIEKAAKSLRDKKGKLEVSIRLTDLKDETLAKLKKAGFKLDDKDKALPVVYGTLDAKDLEALCKLTEVLIVDPIE